MSVHEAQARVSSIEFTEWAVFLEYEAELMGLVERETTPEEVGSKLRAWAAMHNAKQAARR